MAALAVIFAALSSGGSMAAEKFWKGMLLAKPAQNRFSIRQMGAGLMDFRYCRVLCVAEPRGYPPIGSDRLYDLVVARLKGLGIEASTDLLHKFRGPSYMTDQDELRRQDIDGSILSLAVSMTESDGMVAFSVVLCCARGAFLHPGYFNSVIVSNAMRVGVARAGEDIQRQILSMADELLTEFEANWRLCNPIR
jgi:hypothetical protein